MAPRAGLRHTAAMDEEKPTRRPDEPKAAHLPAHGRPCLLPEETEGSPDLMAAGGEMVSAWVLRICGWPTWGRAPRVGRLELLSSTTPPKGAPMKLDVEGKTCRLMIDAQLDAVALDELISRLGEARASMLPHVSKTRPEPGSVEATTTPVSMEDEPALRAVRLRDGRVRLWARSSGFGWLAFNIGNVDACALRDWFTANVQGRSDLFGDSDGHAH